MEQGKISIQAENIFPIIKKFLYSDHEIFLRELISNAIDATNKLKTIANSGDSDIELGDLTIDVKVDKENKTITISDRGIGMSEAEVKKYLNQVAFSSAEAFIKKYKEDANIIGHFGLGFYSAFMVADKVEVITRSYKKSPKAVRWTCDGSPEYGIENTSKEDRGTDIILHIADDSTEFLEDARIEGLLKKYCRFLPIPIRMGTRTETTYEGEGEDKKEIKKEVDNFINNTNPAWKKSPNKLKEADYLDFYNELYPYSEPPLFWIHLNIDYPFNLTGILYFPKLSNQIEVQKNKIHLYSNQVFVTDDVGPIVPEFLTLLHGVIDSPDIPLNVSRSYLQSDANVKKISSYITKKVVDRLAELFKKDREKFESKWDEIGTFIKYGMMSDEKFNEKAMKFALLKDLEGKYYTVEEFKEKIKDAQTNKHDKIVGIYSNAINEHHSYVQAAKNKGYEILLMDNVIDTHFMQHLEYKDGALTFVRVDAEIADKLVEKDDEQASVLTEKETEKLESLFKETLGDGQVINLKPLSPDSPPVLITKPEFMRRMKEMQHLQGGGQMGMMDDLYNIVVNTNNPLVADKLMKMRSEDKKKDLVKYLVDLAKLNQQMLKGAELTTFIEKSMEFLK